MRRFFTTGALALLGWTPASGFAADPRPNIIVILADDLGYSDISPFGGEVRTPNLQFLANNGLRFRNFYNTARCCPSRASLLTGLAPHQAGIGLMTSEEKKQEYDYGTPSYEGFLNRNCVTLAEALKGAGYRTMMAGKWHVGSYEGMWPRDRGFDRFYGIIRGAMNYYQPTPETKLTLDDKVVPLPVPPNFYSTTAFTDHAIDFLEEAVTRHRDQPFFLYLAYNAPHWPLQAPAKYVAHYRSLYAQGWDVLRPKRMEGVIKAGVVPPGTRMSPGIAPAWSSLKPPKQKEMAERMATYAAMVEIMDENIGRVLATLKSLGVQDNTLILFFSDNGGCAEGDMLGSKNGHLLGTKEGYFLTLGAAWANYCNTPFQKFKHFTMEGGMRSPFIACWPDGIKQKGGWSNQIGTIIDLMPTFLDLARGTYPEKNGETKTVPLTGISLVPALKGGAPQPRKAYFEHEGNKAAFDGDWKLVQTFNQPWKLIDIRKDPVESNDLSQSDPPRVAAMAKAWQDWADNAGVLPWPAKKPPGYTPPPRVFPNGAP